MYLGKVRCLCLCWCVYVFRKGEKKRGKERGYLGSVRPVGEGEGVRGRCVYVLVLIGGEGRIWEGVRNVWKGQVEGCVCIRKLEGK